MRLNISTSFIYLSPHSYSSIYVSFFFSSFLLLFYLILTCWVYFFFFFFFPKSIEMIKYSNTAEWVWEIEREMIWKCSDYVRWTWIYFHKWLLTLTRNKEKILILCFSSLREKWDKLVSKERKIIQIVMMMEIIDKCWCYLFIVILNMLPLSLFPSSYCFNAIIHMHNNIIHKNRFTSPPTLYIYRQHFSINIDYGDNDDKIKWIKKILRKRQCDDRGVFFSYFFLSLCSFIIYRNYLLACA